MLDLESDCRTLHHSTQYRMVVRQHGCGTVTMVTAGDPAGIRTTQRPPDHRKETQTAVV